MPHSRTYLAQLKIGASAVFCAAFLAGCDNAGNGAGGARTETVNVPGGTLNIQEKDVEAPDVFQMRAKGLWDGRPSLGGIWVAVPDDVQPDRVRITNLENGKRIIGSLFTHDVSIQGPPILLSSDAAAAVGLVAGSPTDIEIVVLRRETVEVVSQEPIGPDADIPDSEDGDQQLAEDGDTTGPEGIATAALESSVLSAIEETEAPEAAAPETAAPAAAVEPAPEDTPTAEAPAQVATPADAAPAPIPSAIKNPYVQVATVSSPKSANDIVKKLQAGGVAAETRISSSGGKNSFRVVVGPVSTAEEQSAQVNKIRGLGFKDAFPVK